jgi:hypothetical protein
VVRVTTETDYRTRKPFVVRLEVGGRLIRVKTLGARTWFSATVKQLYQLAVETRVRELRAEKQRLRAERRKA